VEIKKKTAIKKNFEDAIFNLIGFRELNLSELRLKKFDEIAELAEKRHMQKNRQKLLEWYREVKRPLPWRLDQDPYRIWISETMLQQTTVTAVLPYYEKFMKRFPTLSSLAQAELSEVYVFWAGLGYYSRARNLHKAAQQLAEQEHFPQTYSELLEYPGFGPYTARAVSSLAFSEPVGVLDGNVIRVMSRYFGQHWEWWKPKVRQEMQVLIDQCVQDVSSSEMNQALMELGATVCRPQSPSCLLCPLQKNCQAWNENQVEALPLKKPRRAREIWVWQAELHVRGDRVAFLQNDKIPFLRDQWVLPGAARLTAKKPKTFDFRHSITHHDIFVKVRIQHQSQLNEKTCKWLKLEKVTEISPTALVNKALQWYQKQNAN